MKRRDFIRNLGLLAGAGTVSMTLGDVPLRAFSNVLSKAAEYNGKILVLIQLSGGNDGLNTVIPFEDSRYYNFRKNIGIRKNDALKLSSLTGLNPGMTSFKKLYDEGMLTVIQSVGYPNQNRSHFRSTDIWLTGSESNQYLNDGWVGRYLGKAFPYEEEFDSEHPKAIQLGASQSILLECTCSNEALGLTFQDPNQFYQLIAGNTADTDPPPNTLAGNQLKYIKEVAARSIRYAEIIKDKADSVENKVNYPNNSLARQLSIVAKLVAGGLETPVYLTSMGGFDTHSDQVNRHRNLLANLSDSVKAFLDDLKALDADDKVVVMTFSEFGRTVEENGSGGTDHGSAAPVFLAGTPVKGGIVGNNPDLSDLDNSGDNKMIYDFRQIYATLLRDHLEMDSSKMPDVLYKQFTTLPLVAAKSIASGGPLSFKLEQNYPNPFPNPLNPGTTFFYTLRLPQNISFKIFNVLGQEVLTLVDGYQDAGEYKVYLDASRLASGVYFARMFSGSYFQTVKIQVIK